MESVWRYLHWYTHALKVLRNCGDPVSFLYAQFGGVANGQSFLAQSSQDGEDGDFIDYGRSHLFIDNASPNATGFNTEIADQFAARLREAEHLDAGAHSDEQVD